MKIALSQFESKTNDIENNKDKILKEIQRAKNDGAELILFSLNSIQGQEILSLSNYIENIKKIKKTYNFLLENIPNDIYVVLNSLKVGKKNKLKMDVGLIYKKNGKIELKLKKNITKNTTSNLTYLFKLKVNNLNFEFFIQSREILKDVKDLKIKDKESIIIINSLVPFYQKSEKDLKTNLIEKIQNKLIYIKPIGVYNFSIYDGGSFYLDQTSKVEKLKNFCTDYKVFSINEPKNEFFKEENPTKSALEAIKYALKTYKEESKFNGIHLGLSGGIDSALCLVIASMIEDPKNIMAIMLPTRFSSKGSIEDAKKLCQNLGVDYKIIPIEDTLKNYEKLFNDNFKEDKIAFQNIQARIRGNILMAYSNIYNSMLLETGNKTEALTGYCTIYGDTCGAIAPIGDLYKREVYVLANFINSEKEIIPYQIIEKMPSAELDYKQTDEANLPTDYETLDNILYEFIEKSKLTFKNIDEKTSLDIINLVKKNEHKRRQLPPVIKIKKSSLDKKNIFPINYK